MSLFRKIAVLVAFLGISAGAQADYILVEANGTIYSGYDYYGSLGTGGGSLYEHDVIATWLFALSEAPSDSRGGSTIGTYNGSYDWVSGTISIASGGSASESDILQDGSVDYNFDSIRIENDRYSGDRDRYEVSTYGYDNYPDYDYFYSYGYWYDWIDDFLQSDDLDQVFTWVNDSRLDDGYGYFEFYDYSRSSGRYTDYAYGSYRINSASATRVPEPGTLALFGIGLLVAGIVRGRKKFI